MKLFDFFKKKYKSSENYFIANLRSVVNIPSRDNLSMKENRMIDEYKKEYLKLLNNKIWVSNDLDIENMMREVQMNLELVSSLFFKDEVNPFNYIDENEKINITTKVNKMNLYLENILLINRKAQLMFLALEEINNSKILLSNKKRVLKNKMENLIYTLTILRNQGEGIFLKASAFLNEYNLYDESISSEEKEIKKNEVLGYVKMVMPEKQEEYNSMKFKDSLEFVAFLERELEIYVYNNKNNKQEYFWNQLLFYDDDNLSYAAAKERLKELELLMRVFSLYGEKIVAEEMINKLCEFKAELLTINAKMNIDNVVSSLDYIDRLSYADIESYDRLIMKKIENIVTGKNEALNFLFIDSNDKNDFVKVANIFRNDDGVFSTYEILNNRKLLMFLISLDYKTGVTDFFNNYMVNIKDYEIPKQSAFTWEEKVPLRTIMELMECGYLEGDDKLFSFYKMIKTIFEDAGRYFIFEGIKKINVELDITRKDEILLIEINKKSKGKTVYTPSTLKDIGGFFNFSCTSLVLNDGCESFSLMEFSCHNYFSISVPSSLKVLYFGNIEDNYLNSIEFRDYKNSNLLQDKNSFGVLCGQLFYVCYTNNDWALERQVFGRFNHLIFEDNGDLIWISDADIRRKFYRAESEKPDKKLREKEIELIMHDIKECIRTEEHYIHENKKLKLEK